MANVLMQGEVLSTTAGIFVIRSVWLSDVRSRIDPFVNFRVLCLSESDDIGHIGHIGHLDCHT